MACPAACPRANAPDVIRAMSTENWLDFVGISIDPKRAEGMRFTVNLITPDNGETHLVEMSNATLTNIKGEKAKNPDLTITLNRSDLNLVMMGPASFDQLVAAGRQNLKATASLSTSCAACSCHFHRTSKFFRHCTEDESNAT